jgi:predicted transcriptional regulator
MRCKPRQWDDEAVVMDDNSSNFLETFNAIEDWLRRQVNAPPGEGFHEVVSRVAVRHFGVKRHASLLKKLGRLRNLVVHEYSRDKRMTVPTSYTVEQITAIRDELLSPPSLYSVCTRPAATCDPSDPVGRAAMTMRDRSFSQLPVYDGSAFVGLLTAETVARWVASNLADGQELMEEERVADVLRHQEAGENHAFLGRLSTVLDGLAAFDAFLHRGKRLEAVLLTDSGRPTEQPLGIVTVHDIPKLRRAIWE